MHHHYGVRYRNVRNFGANASRTKPKATGSWASRGSIAWIKIHPLGGFLGVFFEEESEARRKLRNQLKRERRVWRAAGGQA